MNAIKNNGINKVINIGGIEVPMRASAATPRTYRQVFGKDLLVELQIIKNAYENGEPIDIEVIENMAYLFAYQADPEGVKNIDEWLDQFGMTDIYNAFEDIMTLWGGNAETTSEAKK